MSKPTLCAVAVFGKRNLTRITAAYPQCDETYERLARVVRKKDPTKTYVLVEVDDATWGTRRKEIIFDWHVGEGFEHSEGWWVHAAE